MRYFIFYLDFTSRIKTIVDNVSNFFDYIQSFT